MNLLALDVSDKGIFSHYKLSRTNTNATSRMLTFLCCVLFVHLCCAASDSQNEQQVLYHPGASNEDPVSKPVFPETQEFIDKIKALKTVQDVEALRIDDDTFELVDFGKSNLPIDKSANTSPKPPRSCKADSKEATKSSSSPSQNGTPITTTSSSHKTDASHGDGKDTDSGAGKEDQASTYVSTKDESHEVVNTTSPIAQTASEPTSVVYDATAGLPGSLGSVVEDRMLNTSPKPSVYAGANGKASKRKKKIPEEPAPPTKEQLEETYKYEVLPPPDNSPVTLDFPATPAAQGEDHLSQHVPLPLYCDSCMAIAFQLHTAFSKFHDQIKKRPPTESDIYHLVGESCLRERFNQYGMLEMHGKRYITGPGCNKLEAEGGVKHSRGPWPKRISERCEEVTEDVGELVIHTAWLNGRRDPEKLKQFLCFGTIPRNYCQRYGYIDGEAEAAAYRRRKEQEAPHEEPVEAASRLAREAAFEAEQEAAAQAEQEGQAHDAPNDEL